MASSKIFLTMEHGFIKLLLCRGRMVEQHRVIIASPDFFREGLVRDGARVGGMIRSALEEMEVKPTKTIGAVPGFQTYMKVIEFPKSSGFDPEIVIPREAARNMGVSQSTSRLTWQRIDGVADRSRWLVMSAARRAIEAYLKTAAESQLRVSALDLRAFALSRAVNRSEAIIAWIAPDGCDVVVVRNSIPVAHQALFWGAEPVEGLVLVYRLTEIIERTVSGYDAENPDGPLPGETPMYICGSPISFDKSVVTQVGDSLQRVVGELAPPLDYPEDFPVDDFVVNMGLALREA